MLKVALTGGIATGKSYVLDRFAAARRADASTRMRWCTASRPRAPRQPPRSPRASVAEVLAADGSVNRAQLGPVVFARSRRPPRSGSHRASRRLSRVAAGIRAFELTGAYRVCHRRRAAAVRNRSRGERFDHCRRDRLLAGTAARAAPRARIDRSGRASAAGSAMADRAEDRRRPTSSSAPTVRSATPMAGRRV